MLVSTMHMPVCFSTSRLLAVGDLIGQSTAPINIYSIDRQLSTCACGFPVLARHSCRRKLTNTYVYITRTTWGVLTLNDNSHACFHSSAWARNLLWNAEAISVRFARVFGSSAGEAYPADADAVHGLGNCREMNYLVWIVYDWKKYKKFWLVRNRNSLNPTQYIWIESKMNKNLLGMSTCLEVDLSYKWSSNPCALLFHFWKKAHLQFSVHVGGFFGGSEGRLSHKL